MPNGRWRASIRPKGKYIGLGVFDDIREAAQGYNAAALAFYGEFAVLNKIPDGLPQVKTWERPATARKLKPTSTAVSSVLLGAQVVAQVGDNQID